MQGPQAHAGCGQRPRFFGGAGCTAARHDQPAHGPAHSDTAGRRHDTSSTDTDDGRDTLTRAGLRAPLAGQRAEWAGGGRGGAWPERSAGRAPTAFGPSAQRWGH